MKPLTALVLALAACSQDNQLTVHVITPLGDDPLSDAATVRLAIGQNQVTSAVASGHFTSALTLTTASPADVAPLTLSAFKSDGTTLTAYGATPPLQLSPQSGSVWIYVAKPRSIGSPPAGSGVGPATLAEPRSRLCAVAAPGLGVFLGGGRGANGAPSANITLWFPYELLETQSTEFALSVAREALACGVDGSSYIDWVGGADATGAASSLGEIMDPSGQIGPPLVRPEQAAGAAPLARARAAGAVGSEGLLLFGGAGADGMAQPGAILFTAMGSQAVGWQGAVPRLGATATAILGGAQVIVFGGAPAGAAVLERYVSRTSAAVVSPNPTGNRTDHSATLLGDGRILYVGGSNDAGNPLASATILDPTTGAATELPSFLAHPRAHHTATLAGKEILIAGGSANGALVAPAEAFDSATLAKLAEVTLAVPRQFHAAVDPGNGSVVLLGGEDAAGQPVGQVEIYQPAP
jgi:hypothetical protein